jgi:hypothetical protein
VLGVLVGVLMVVLFANRAPAPLAEAPVRAGAERPAAGARPPAGGVPEVGVVRLDALGRAVAEPPGVTRDPFRFRTAAPPPPAAGGGPAFRPGGAGVAGAGGPPPIPLGPPPPPPIPLKFIGLVEQAPGKLKLAVLSDGRNVFYGKEGDTIEGRYRIERIGPESIEMAYLDGRGRQTLRLSGS